MTYVEGQGVPTIRHESHKEAREEADRLAHKTGKRVFVLVTSSYCEVHVAPVIWHGCRGVEIIE